MKTLKQLLILICFAVCLPSCKDMFDYSIYATNLDENQNNNNLSNLNKTTKSSANDTVRLAFTSDTHRFYDEFNGFVNKVNEINKQSNIDFVVHAGDLADFGIPQQYEWGNDILKKLDCPYFVVVGNHDLVGSGKDCYEEMFGDLNFSFKYKGIKFIFIDTNSREYGYNGKVPDINWLESELSGSDAARSVVVFHVPPDHDDFDGNLKENFMTIIEKHDNVLFTIHGHIHKHELYTPEHHETTYINIYGIERKKFNIITITGNKFKVEERKI